MKYAIFIGCTIASRGLNYETSTRNVFKHLGIELIDVPEFSCCGYPLSHVDRNAMISLSARNIAIAEEKNLDIAVMCSACAGTLTKANELLRKNDEIRDMINGILANVDREFSGKVKVKHISRILYEDVGIKKIKEKVKYPLNIKCAPHYGCHYIRPSDYFDNFDSPIRPKTLHELIKTTGANALNYPGMERCCGGDVLAIKEEISVKMVKRKLDDMKSASADAIILHCPFCSIMYDEYQPTIEEKFGEKYNLPVLYITQLIGLSFGMNHKKHLALHKNNVKCKELLEKLEVI